MEVVLTTKEDLYTDPDKKGRVRLIKKGVVTKIIVDTNDITTINELVDNSGTVLKDYSRINVKDTGPIVVNHSVDYLRKLKKPKSNPIGFKFKNK